MADRRLFRPLPTALAILEDIRRSHPEKFQFKSAHFDRLAGTDAVKKSGGAKPACDRDRQDMAEKDLKEFETAKNKFLLYP